MKSASLRLRFATHFSGTKNFFFFLSVFFKKTFFKETLYSLKEKLITSSIYMLTQKNSIAGKSGCERFAIAKSSQVGKHVSKKGGGCVREGKILL